MTKVEFESLGLTIDQYPDYIGEDPIIEDAEVTKAEEVPVAAPIVESTVEEPVIETDVSPIVEETVTEPVQTEAEVVDAIVPVEAKAEVAANSVALEFKNIKAAAEYLAEKLGLKLSNTLDCLYKAKRSGKNKTHGFIAEYREDKTVSLTTIA